MIKIYDCNTNKVRWFHSIVFAQMMVNMFPDRFCLHGDGQKLRLK